MKKALSLVSKKQLASGGFATYGEETAESSAQVIVALTELGIPLDDSRFVKNGKTVLDAMLAFRLPSGGFKHINGQTTADGMASEQCFYALVAAERANAGKSSLYRMSDAKKADTPITLTSIVKDMQMLASEKNTKGITLSDVIYKISKFLKSAQERK